MFYSKMYYFYHYSIYYSNSNYYLISSCFHVNDVEVFNDLIAL